MLSSLSPIPPSPALPRLLCLHSRAIIPHARLCWIRRRSHPQPRPRPHATGLPDPTIRTSALRTATLHAATVAYPRSRHPRSRRPRSRRPQPPPSSRRLDIAPLVADPSIFATSAPPPLPSPVALASASLAAPSPLPPASPPPPSPSPSPLPIPTNALTLESRLPPPGLHAGAMPLTPVSARW